MLLRLSDEEHALLVAAAARTRLTPTGYAARAALDAAAGRPGQVEVLAAVRLLGRDLQGLRGEMNRLGGNVNQAVKALHATGRMPDVLPRAVGRWVAQLDQLDGLYLRLRVLLRGWRR